MLKSVVFDLDGTLVDTIDLIVRSFNYTLKFLAGRDFTREEVIALFGPTEPVIIDRFAKPGEREEAYRLFFQTYENEHDRLVRVFPGVPALIRGIQSAGLGVGLVTNKGRRTTEITLQKLGLMPFFRAVVTGDEADRPKPDPSGIERALEKLDTRPEEALFVGDAPVDILAGRAAGTATCAVSWGGVHPLEETLAAGPDYVCRSAEELAGLIQRLMP